MHTSYMCGCHTEERVGMRPQLCAEGATSPRRCHIDMLQHVAHLCHVCAGNAEFIKAARHRVGRAVCVIAAAVLCPAVVGECAFDACAVEAPAADLSDRIEA